MNAEVWRLPAAALRDAFLRRDLSPVEVTDALAERIAAVEPTVNAFVTLTLETARVEARRAEEEYAAGEARPLAGIPLAIKDVFDTAGVRTTYGSSVFRDRVPDRDAELVRRARDAGAVVLGKTSTHEFGWGITSVNPHHGSPRNPWAADRVAGGSSGGSAVAVAVGETALALGSDTGGSVRIPASFCGVVGFKPSFGSLPTDGLFPLAPSLDHVGFLARTPADARLLLDAVQPAARPIEADVRGLVVAVCPDLDAVAPADDVRAVFEQAIATFADRGAEVVELPFPGGAAVYDTFRTIQLTEALLVHRDAGLYPARADEYGPDVRSRLELAGGITFDAYVRATQERQRLEVQAARLFETADVLLSLCSAVTAPPPTDEIVHAGETMPLRDAVMPFTTPQDLLGLPTCAVRAGFDSDGLPVGVQVTGPRGADRLVLEIAQQFFDATKDVQAVWPDPFG